MSKNSTVAIDEKVSKKLDRFCKEKGFSKKDFISLSLSYFMQYGINPQTDKSPAEALEKISRRIEDVIKIQKAQEKDIFRPLFLKMVEVNEGEELRSQKQYNFFNEFLKAFDKFSEFENERFKLIVEHFKIKL